MKKTSFFLYFIIIVILVGGGLFGFYKNDSEFNEAYLSQHIEDSQQWERLARKIATTDGKVAFDLATYYEKLDNFKHSELWFKQAIRLDYINATIALASLYFTYEKFELAKKTLASYPFKNSEYYLVLSIEIAVQLGDVDFIQKNHTQLNDFKSGHKLLEQLRKYKIIEIDQTFPSTSLCENTVQLIATNFRDLAKADQHIQRFNKHELSKYFCFSPVIYQSLKSLNCRNNVNFPEQAIECDESIWNNKIPFVNTRYLALLLPKGGANVHKGILYLDYDDSFNVFVHELTHLLGFIDEYALPEKHSACMKNQSKPWAHNIAVLPEIYYGEKAQIRKDILAMVPWAKYIQPQTPILTPIKTPKIPSKNQQGWILGTPKEYNNVGVFLSETCNNSDFTSFKPLSSPSMLTYNELEFPLLYIDFIKHQSNKYRMPSYHLNVATALWLKGKESEAKQWFNQLLP